MAGWVCTSDTKAGAESSIGRRAPSVHLGSRLCTGLGGNGVSRCSTPRCRPSSPTTSRGGPDAWSAMFCPTVTSVSYPWWTPHKAGVRRKRHTKRPGGSLFPLRDALTRRSKPSRKAVARVCAADPCCHACLHLRAAAQGSLRVNRRRSLPPGIVTLDPQTGRERPRVWDAKVSPDPSQGVAHALSAGVAATHPAAREACVVTTTLHARTHASPAAPHGRHVRRQTVGQTWGRSVDSIPVQFSFGLALPKTAERIRDGHRDCVRTTSSRIRNPNRDRDDRCESHARGHRDLSLV